MAELNREAVETASRVADVLQESLKARIDELEEKLRQAGISVEVDDQSAA